MAKNYYWNHGCEFPMTSQDWLEGRAYMYLEAIRKLCFLLRFPGAGYYTDDMPCTTNLSSVGDGDLAVYHNGNIYYKHYNESTELWEIQSDTYYNYFTALALSAGSSDAIFKKGQYRLYSDGVIWSWAYPTGEYAGNAYYYGIRSVEPPAGGWFAPNSKGYWIKSPSRNRYYEWSLSSLRNVYDGDVCEADEPFPFIDLGGRDYKFLPKNFDPYCVDQAMYKVPEDMLNKPQYKTGIALTLNQYYWYDLSSGGKTVKRLWKCKNVSTEDTPSITSADWEMFVPTFSAANVLFTAKDVEINKHQFFNEEINGATYDTYTAVVSPSHPYQAFSQYAQITGWPVGLGSSFDGNSRTFDEPKLCETIAAYVEAMFDWNAFYWQVDGDYKTNYHTACDGVYGGEDYASYDAAARAGKIDIIQRITDIWWGCNGSGFEWALKKLGTYDWYFDSSTPQYYSLQLWLNQAIENEDEALQEACEEVIASITGTWRRTWKNSIGRPQEAIRMTESGTYPTGMPPYPYLTGGTYTAWINDAKSSFVTVAQTAESPLLHQPDRSYYYNEEKVREWDIDKLIAFVNEIWDVLNVSVGYKGSTITMQMRSNLAADSADSIGLLNSRIAAQFADAFFWSSWSSASSISLANDLEYRQVLLSTNESGYTCHRTAFAIKITASELDKANINPAVKLNLFYKYWTTDLSGSGWPEAAYRTMSIRSQGGNLAIAATVSYNNPLYANAVFGYIQIGWGETLQGYFTTAPEEYVEPSYYTEDEYHREYFGFGAPIDLQFLTNQVLFTYDWNGVRASVWGRDVNFPTMVESFELPILPPYPNPPYWTIPTQLQLNTAYIQNSFMQNMLYGTVSNCTSVPAGRTVKYIFRLDTLFDLSTETVDDWDSDTSYVVSNLAAYNGRVYRCLIDNTNKIPSDEPTYWVFVRLAFGWTTLIKNAAQYEYIDNKYIAKIDDEAQDEPNYVLELNSEIRDLLQEYVWYFNFCAWRTYAKAYEGDVVYDTGECLPGIRELIIDESSRLDTGVYYSSNLNGDTGIWTVDFLSTGWGGDENVLKETHPYIDWDEYNGHSIYEIVRDDGVIFEGSQLLFDEDDENDYFNKKFRVKIGFYDYADQLLYTFISGWRTLIN